MITKDDFITVTVPDWMVEAAHKKHQETPDYTPSFGENTSRPAGFAAEMVISETLEAPIVGEYLTTHDFELDGYKVDLKTVKRTRIPELYYEVNILAKNLKNQGDLDYYFFADTNEDGSVITFLGYISKEDFDRLKIPHEKGSTMNPRTGAVWHEDAYSVKVKHLKPFTWVKDKLCERFTCVQ